MLSTARVLGAACILVILPVFGAHASPAGRDRTYFIIVGELEQFSAEFKPMPPESERQIGFGPVLYTLKTPVEDLRKQVNAALDKAEKTGYPVLITLDDWNFPPPSSDPEVVEWTDWPAPGEKYGPIVKRRWICWGPWFPTEAPRNFESPRVRADVEERLKNGIIPPIVEHLDKWEKDGRDYLFAGLVTGWETGYYTNKNTNVRALKPEQRPSADGQTMNEEDDVNTGYAALTARGYTRESVGKLAHEKGLTEDRMIHELMQDVLRDYSVFWTRVCYANGIPRNRIYTHYASPATLPVSKIPPGLVGDGRVVAMKCALTPYGRPGATVMEGLCDIEVLAKELGGPKKPWGAVEIDLGDSTRTKEGASGMINELSDSGAKVIAVYGWWCPKDSPFYVQTPGVLAAIHEWLEGRPAAGSP